MPGNCILKIQLEIQFSPGRTLNSQSGVMHKVLDRGRKTCKYHDIRMYPVNNPLDVVLVELVDKRGLIEALCNPREHLHPDIGVTDDQDIRFRRISALVITVRMPWIVCNISDF